MTTPTDDLSGGQLDAGIDSSFDGAREGSVDDAAIVFTDVYEASREMDAARPSDASVDSSYVQTVRDSRPLAYFRLGEAAGPNAKDEVSGVDGTYVGNLTLLTAGAIAGDPNTAVTFAGGHIDLGKDRFEFPSGADFTIELWANVFPGNDASSQGPNLFRVGQTSLTGYGLALTNDGMQCFGRDAQGNGFSAIAPVPRGRFAHIVCVEASGTLALFANGVQLASTQGVVASSAPGISSTLGDAPTLDRTYFGVLDDVAVYDHALAADEIAAHYHAGIGQ